MSELCQLSIDELKKLSKNWTPEEWEKYLEGLEGKRTEYLFKSGNEISRFSEGVSWAGSADPDDPRVQVLREIMATLPARHQEILDLIFWQGLSERKAAEALGVSRRTLVVLCHRILRRLLKEFMLRRVSSNLPIIEKECFKEHEVGFKYRQENDLRVI